MITEVTFSPPLHSIFNMDYVCGVSSVSLSTTFASAFETYQEQQQDTSFYEFWKDRQNQLVVKIYFSATTYRHSLGPLQAPTSSSLYIFFGEPGYPPCVSFHAPAMSSIEGDDMSNLYGWLVYELKFDPNLRHIEWAYGSTGFSKVELPTQYLLNDPLRKIISAPQTICDAISKAATK